MNRNLRVRILAASLCLASVYQADAQSPGGVAPAAWYRADAASLFSNAGTTPVADNGTVHQWNSQIGSFSLIQASSTRKPVYSNSNLANFNPTVTFDGSNDYLETEIASGNEIIDRSNGTIYAAGQKDRLKRSGFAGFHPTMDYPGLHVHSNYKLRFYTGGPGYQGLSTEVMAAGRYFTAGTGWTNGLGASPSYALATVSLNGSRGTHNGSEFNNVGLTNNARNFRLGGDSNYGAFSGQLNEVLIYGTKLTEDQMDRVESYLAIKYGSTYANGTRDYKNSAGATVWSAATNNNFHYNVAGIARDDAGALYQKQSWSTNPEQQVLIGVGGLSDSNAGNSGTLNNGDYLIWGDNGQTKTPTVATSAFGGLSHHFAAIWKVSNPGGNVGTVRIAWPKGFTNLTLIQSNDATIGGGDNTTPMSAEKNINGVDYNYADVDLANGQYFTFGVKLAAPGGVTGDLRVWLKSDEGFTPSSWADFSGFGNHYTQAHASRQPFTATKMYNYNPVVDFGTTGSDGRFMVVPSGKPYSANGTSSSVFTVSLDRSTSGYADLIGFGATTTTASYVNANRPVYTRLGNYMRLYPATGVGSNLPLIVANRLYMNDVSFTVGSAGIKYAQDGRTHTVNTTYSAGNSLHANGSILGSQPERRNGLIGEVIAYQRDLTEAEKQRVRTYTAIKYGITLPHDYIASDGTTIAWSQTGNPVYNKNIAGLANDEGSNLVQKQSNSINSGQQVLIGTTGLSNSNAENGTSIAPGSFLLWGDNGAAKSLSVAHNTTVGSTDLNLRFGAIWKVKNTGSVGTVRVAWPSGIPSIHFVKSADETFDATDEHIPMTETISINGASYNYVDVVLETDTYFTFAGYIVGPGGVASAAWYRADGGGQQFSDAGTTEANDGQQLQQWNEFKGTGYNLVQSSPASRPIFSNASKLANFNPTVTFNGGQWMRHEPGANVNVIDRNDGTLYASGYLSRSGNSDLAGFGSTTLDYPGLHTHTTGGNLKALFYTAGGPAYNGVSTNNLQTNHYFTMGAGWANGAGNPTASRLGATVSLNGSRVNYDGTGSIANVGQTALNADGIYRAFRIGDGNYGGHNGQLNEVVVFENRLSEADMDRVETYMSIKYGNTFGDGAKDYVNSSSIPVWKTADNQGYHYNIAGIARDDQGSLYQKQSWSTNPGRQVLISTTGLANTNAGNTAVLSNGQFLIWGDNNLSKGPSVAITGISGVNYRFASIWKAQNTGNVGTVRVAWPAGFANLKLIQSSDDVISSSDVITDMTATQVVNGVEYAYADVTIADGEYFTFAAFIQAPGGVTNNLSYWYRADKLVDAAGEDADVINWTDFTSGTSIAQLGENALPKLKNGNATYFNFNPGVNYTNAAQALGNLNVQTVTALNFDIYTLTKESISPGGNGRVFSSLVDNVSTTGSVWHWDGIGLNAGGSLERVNTARTNRYLANPGNIDYVSGVSSIMYNTFTDLTAAKGVNGAPNGTTGNYASARGQMTGGHAIGSTQFSSNSSDNAGFSGHIGELVVYGSGNNTAAERNKVESYLAIKYGLTLHNGNNYTTSGDAVVWNTTADASYYNNVAGIGNDYLSALHQKQSTSQHPNGNGQVIIGLGDIAETNAANTGNLADGQFLVWGDNNIRQAMTATAAHSTPFTYAGSPDNGRRMNRVWKVRNTNNVSDEVLIRFPKASVHSAENVPSFGANNDCAAYVIIFASDENFTSNVSVKAVTLNEDGVSYDAAHNFPAGTSYFTYGRVVPLNQGIVYLPGVTEDTEEYGGSCAVGEWTYFHKTGDNSQKLIAFSGFSNAEMDEFVITITPEGAEYAGDTRTTKLMSRITTVTDAGATYSGTKKVRVYYDQNELNATTVDGETVSGWYKYAGDADETIIDVYSDGLLDPSKAVAITPTASGVEDGVSYVEFDGITSFSSFVYLSTTDDSPLPVTLTSFKAVKEGQSAVVTWSTTNELGNSGFEVERSSDARNWNSIGFVTAKSAGGDSNSSLDYSFTDGVTLPGRNYYRLKQIDLSGEFSHSHVVSLNFAAIAGLTVYPNPVAGGKLKLNMVESFGKEVKIYSMTGVEVLRSDIKENVVDVSHLSSGQYIIQVIAENGEVVNRRFVVP